MTVTATINYHWEADRRGELGAYVASIPLAFRSVQLTSATSVFRPAGPFLWPLGDLEWKIFGHITLPL